MSDETITPQEDRRARFVAEYLVDHNATQAAIRAGYSPRSAYAQGSRLLKDDEVQAEIAKGREKLAATLEMTTVDIARHLANIIIADPNELIEYRRVCCRYCWGEGFLYQRTPQEMRVARAKHEQRAANPKHGEVIGEFDVQGGDGYNANLGPNPECPECHGHGSEQPFPKDTRNMSEAARALYAGVKITRDGIEIKMHSKERALEMYGRHLGMFKDKLEVGMTEELADAMRVARERATSKR